jgi:hypothetical protein
MVYMVIIAILAAGLVLGFAFWYYHLSYHITLTREFCLLIVDVDDNREKAKDVENAADTNNTNGSSAKAMKVLAGITWGLTAIYFLLLIALRDRIEYDIHTPLLTIIFIMLSTTSIVHCITDVLIT